VRQDSRNEVLSSKSFYPSLVVPEAVFVERDYPVVGGSQPVDRPLSIFHPPAWLLV
jgi:hypothetical protein